MKNDRYFRTSSFQCGCFLFAKGMELVDIDKISNPRRANFVFVDTPEREDFLQAFNFAKEGDTAVMVDARKLFTAMRQLKEKLYQDTF